MKEEKLIKLLDTRKGQKALFDAYHGQLHAVALRYLKVKEDAQDVLCEAYVRIFNRINNFEFRGDGSLKKWMKTIVINESLRFINRKRKLVFKDEINDGDLEFTNDLDGEMDMEFFMEIVNSLPDGYRLVFLMFAVEGYSHKEIADELNISVSTSKSQLFKARSLIVKKLKKIEPYESFGNRKPV